MADTAAGRQALYRPFCLLWEVDNPYEHLSKSDGNNLLTLINRYMDQYRRDPDNIGAKAKAEKYAKILAKTIVNPGGDDSSRGQNAYFYDAAEGLLAAVVLLLAEFLPPWETDGLETRHIASVFKLVQELLESGRIPGKNRFQELMTLLPPDHKAKWLAGSALTAADQAKYSKELAPGARHSHWKVNPSPPASTIRVAILLGLL